MTGPMRGSKRRWPGWGSSRPRSAVRSRSCQCQPVATPRIQAVRAARDLGERGQHPFPGGGRGIGVGRRPSWLLVGRGCGASRPCSLSGSWWAEGSWLTTAWLCSWSWLVSMCPLLAMPQLLGDVGMVVLVQLGVMAVGVGHGEPPPVWPCLPEPHPGCRSSIPAVDRQVDRQSRRQPGSTADSPGRLYTS
jgi:hypothetical protein